MEHEGLVRAGRELKASFDDRSRAFEAVVKVGRTHLQDAVPINPGAGV